MPQDDWLQRPVGPTRLLIKDLVMISLVVTVALVAIFRLWDTSLRVPFGYGGDGLIYLRDAKNIVQTGWVQETPRLGAPFGQYMYDFPISGDTGNYLIIRLMAIGSGDWVLITNLFFLLSFYTASWSAYLSLRWLRCGRTSAAICAVLFGFAPYHFGRGAGHLMLGSYFVIPLGLLLCVRAASGHSLASASDSSASCHLTSIKKRVFTGVIGDLSWLILCALCGSFGTYYAFFVLITLLMTSSAIAASRHSIRPILAAVSYAVVIAATLLVNLVPNLMYRSRHGINPYVAVRQPIELDLYGLRLIQLITPVPGHWLQPLRAASEDLRQGFSSEGSQFFGLVGGVSLIAMLGWLALLTVRSEATSRDGRPEEELRAILAFLTIAWILVATTGGLDWLAVLVGFTQLRAWNRVSILLMFVTLAWLALTVGPLFRRWMGDSGGRRLWAAGLAGIVLIFGLADQGSASFVPDGRVYRGTFSSDTAFFTFVERQLPRGSMVYQLPYRRFPEEPALNSSTDYDLLRPYLQSQELRWSYGGMKGRESDWQGQLVGVTAKELIRSVIAVGFNALVIDRAGYLDYGASIERELSALTGRQLTQSPDGRWSFFDLTSLSSKFGTEVELAGLKDHLLNQPRVELQGCSGVEGSGKDQFNWCGRVGSIHIVDPRPGRVPYRLTAFVIAPAGPGTLTFDIDGKKTTFAVGAEPTPISVALPAGPEIVANVSIDVAPIIVPGDPRDLRYRLVFAQVLPVA